MARWQVAVGAGLALGVAIAFLTHPFPETGRVVRPAMEAEKKQTAPLHPPTPPPQRSEQMVPVTVYFVTTRNEGGQEYLVPVTRRIHFSPDPAQRVAAVVAELLQGPTPEEKARGLVSSVPPGTRLLGVSVKGDTVELDFSPEIQPPGGSAWVASLLDSLTYTVTSIEGIRQVRLSIEGRPTGTAENPFSSEGALFDALSRQQVTTPVWNPR